MTSVRSLLRRLNGNRPFLLLLLGGSIVFSSCSRKIFTTREKEKEKEEPQKEEVEIEKERGPFKREKPVLSLMLPFQLDKANPDASSLESFRQSELALDFYQGFRMGLDSLAARGASFELRVYDTRDEVGAVSRLILKPELAESELIVGPVYPTEQTVLGRFAQSQQVYFVSPLAPRLGVQGNPYQIVATAPMEMHTRKAVEFISGDLRPESVVVVSTGDDDESRYIGSFMRQMQEHASSVSVSEADVGSFGSDIASLKGYLKAGRRNVLVVPSQKPTFWKILFTYLDMLPDNYQYTLIAHPGFVEEDEMDLALAEKYQVHVTASGSLEARPGSAFYDAYVGRYGLPPSEYATKGFDLAMYFGAALWNGRENLAEELDKSYSGYEHDFEFVKTPDGYINQEVKILRIQNYEWVELK